MSTNNFYPEAVGDERDSMPGKGYVTKPASLHVFSIGTFDPVHISYDVFLSKHDCAMSSAADYRELCGISSREPCDVAILQCTLSRSDVSEAACLVRRRWPSARILVVRDSVPFLADALYEHRVMPGIEPEALLSVIRNLTARR